MFLSLNSTLVTGRVQWPEFARLAAQAGFRGVDVKLDPAMSAGVAATRRLLDDLKIRPAIIDLPVEFRKDDAAFRTSLPKLEEAAPFAAAIGCPRMITWLMSSSATPKDELRRVYKKRFTETADILARSHVRLGLEFLGPLHLRTANPHEFIWRMNEMLEFTKECGSNVGLLLDAWHWHHAGATPADIVAAGKDRIVHVHFDDSPDLPPEKIRDNERLMPGEGVINLVGFLQALKKIGYEDALSVEVFGRGLKDMAPEDAARLGLRTAREVLRKADVAET
jgi:sugar phosphate isomerase/epimerase